MNATRLTSEIDSLPADLKLIAFDFIQNLKLRNQKESEFPAQSNNINEIRMKFFGIWKDRKDMEDSSQWVRNIRKNEMG